MNKPDFDSHPDESLALSATCSCGDTYQPMTINGDLVDWCGTCRRWTPVPRRGVRTHEQRDEMEVEMARAAKVATSSKLHTSPGAATRASRILVGKHDQAA